MPPRDSDEADFAALVPGVVPLPESKRERVEPSRASKLPPPKLSPDEQAYAELEGIARGTGPFDIADTGEYISGLAPGVDRRLLRRLRRGEFAVQAHLDLHGLRADEAKREVEVFLRESRAASRRCVLIVHGRGLRSKDHIPVLKEKLVKWLSQGRLGREVLAFSTAKPHDGGAGALYVLLRR